MAMHADDQLRQRVSWGLSQIISVGLPDSGRVFYEVSHLFHASSISLSLQSYLNHETLYAVS
jgi:hypothetical protein